MEFKLTMYTCDKHMHTSEHVCSPPPPAKSVFHHLFGLKQKRTGARSQNMYKSFWSESVTYFCIPPSNAFKFLCPAPPSQETYYFKFRSYRPVVKYLRI